MDENGSMRLEAALRSAAAAYVQGLRHAERETRRRREIEATLRRLGFEHAAAAIADASRRDTLPAAQVRAILAALEAEMAKLLRRARANHPAYDLNRHIAVKRTLAWLSGETESPRTLASPRSQDRPSGRALNDRFRRRGAPKPHWDR
ncbi:hypothetical protein [Consotaella aegiceratis]|uniref:hypothetical protein n=1 Tax=Consotaella aegiceratis TaxID=3097961 RepID=UPI002F424CB5